MRDKKLLTIILMILLIGISSTIYTRITQQKDGGNNSIIVGMGEESEDEQDLEIEDELLISKNQATNLVLEQVDIKDYNIAIKKGIKTIEEERYYLFDIINKSGPSFATQIAVNLHTGEIRAYDPDKKTLMSMEAFPIETPIGKTQDWNRIYIKQDGSGIFIELFQGDSHSFEFYVHRDLAGQQAVLMQGVAQISGSAARYVDEKGYSISFIKDDKRLKVMETGQSSFQEENIELQGLYTQKD